MTEIVVRQMPAFKRTYKKLHKQELKLVTEAIKKIIDNPNIGQEKKGGLSGVYVYKIKIHKQLYLIAYEWSRKQRILLALGVHENFYRNLKR